MRQPGLALHRLIGLMDEPLPPDVRHQVMNELGVLYAESAQYENAAKAWRETLALHDDPALQLRLARIERLSGQAAEATARLAALSPNAIPSGMQAEYYDELSFLRGDRGDRRAALDALDRAIVIAPTAERWFRRGVLNGQIGAFDKAVEDLEKAHRGEPENGVYLTSLGYAYNEAGRTAEARTALERAVGQRPDVLPLYEDIAYLARRESDNAEASRWFERAIDSQVASAASRPTPEQEEKLFRLRRENESLNHDLSGNAFVNLRSGVSGQQFDPISRSATTSQGSVELAYRPPRIGFRDGRILQAFSRVFWNFDGVGPDVDGDSLQLGLGLRYKPFKEQNFLFGGERLVAIGDNARNDWLLRVSYSADDGFDIRPAARNWRYLYGFADAAYLVSDEVTFLAGEGRAGWSFKFASGLVMTPYALLAGNGQLADGNLTGRLEGGAGLSAKLWFNESSHEAYRTSVEVLPQYRGSLNASDDGGHAFVLTTVLGF
jgi:tetratricopeptide (TPR) repeat protein